MMLAHIFATHESVEEFSDHGTIVTSWSALAAEVELHAGRPDQAEAILAASVDALKTGGDTGWLATNTAWLAEALYRHRCGRASEGPLTRQSWPANAW